MSAAAAVPLLPVRTPVLWLALFVLAGALAAGINLGTLHDGQTADSLLLSLISTQRWTPFYWAQDRYGMLLPLLAAPVEDPLANLLLQGSLMTTAALLAPFLVARFLCRRDEPWVAVGALANLLLFAFTSPYLQFEWFVPQPYALGLALGFAGLVAIDAAQGWMARAAALLLLALAHWVNVSVVVALAPALLLRGGTPGAWSVLGLGTVAGIAAGLLAAAPATPRDLVPVADWPQAWLALLRSTWNTLANVGFLWLALAGSALGSVALVRQGRARALSCVAVAIGAALANWLAVGTFEWVRVNLSFPRYLLPSLLLLAVAAAIPIALPGRRHATPLAAASWLALCILVLLSYGLPSLARVERGFDERLGRMTPEILSSHARVIAGNYWTVWPAVFHANLSLYRQSSADRVLGLAFRSSVTDDLWLARSEPILVATGRGDAEAAQVAAGVDRQLTLVEQRATIDLYTASPRDPGVGP